MSGLDLSQTRPPLHDAIIHKRYEEALILLYDGKVDVNELDFVHNMAIIYLLRRIRRHKGFTNYLYEIEIYKTMFDYPIDLDRESESGRTVREYIMETGIFELYQILFHHHRWIYHDLSTAISYKNKEVFVLLVDTFKEREICFDDTNDDELTALDVSIYCEDVFYCQYLSELCHSQTCRLAYFRAKISNKQEHLAILKPYVPEYPLKDFQKQDDEDEAEEEQEQEAYQQKIEVPFLEWYD